MERKGQEIWRRWNGVSDGAGPFDSYSEEQVTDPVSRWLLSHSDKLFTEKEGYARAVNRWLGLVPNSTWVKLSFATLWVRENAQRVDPENPQRDCSPTLGERAKALREMESEARGLRAQLDGFHERYRDHFLLWGKVAPDQMNAKELSVLEEASALLVKIGDICAYGLAPSKKRGGNLPDNVVALRLAEMGVAALRLEGTVNYLAKDVHMAVYTDLKTPPNLAAVYNRILRALVKFGPEFGFPFIPAPHGN